MHSTSFIILGLDAAAAENIMQEIVRVAKDERIIILCTIHQPSTKVYNGFDETMIMSRARTAYIGDVKEAAPYFERIGYPVPPQTNPAGSSINFTDFIFFLPPSHQQYTYVACFTVYVYLYFRTFFGFGQCGFFG
jgi:ABC-type multidrug transport system ATPase subunit